MARITRAVARLKPTRLDISQSPSSRARRRLRDDGIPKMGEKPSDAPKTHRPEADAQEKGHRSKPVASTSDTKEIQPNNAEEISIRNESQLEVEAAISRRVPSSAGIGLASGLISSYFSSPSSSSRQDIYSYGMPSKSINGRLAGRVCFVTGATSGIGICLS
jgi:hypothetical protein